MSQTTAENTSNPTAPRPNDRFKAAIDRLAEAYQQSIEDTKLALDHMLREYEGHKAVVSAEMFKAELDALCRRYDVTIATFTGETKAVSRQGWSINLED